MMLLTMFKVYSEHGEHGPREKGTVTSRSVRTTWRQHFRGQAKCGRNVEEPGSNMYAEVRQHTAPPGLVVPFKLGHLVLARV